ncbi:hypothetical protein J7M02_02625 [Candidatus Aerophobetes bacterium]|nr:hypothetical protein [Candidatus Aerophobetes bacterium]
MDKETIYVKYYKENIDKKLDKEIIEALKMIGFVWIGSGYHLVKKYRDIQFERKLTNKE